MAKIKDLDRRMENRERGKHIGKKGGRCGSGGREKEDK